MSLGLTEQPLFGATAPEPRHKSAGWAFLFSLFLPGTGQLYCGKVVRGVITLVLWVFGTILSLAGPTMNARGTGLGLAFPLWVFAFLDAYFTATEINQGIELQVEAQNPRVAVILNLLTAGLGYFYLGERIKGIVLFIAINFLKFGIAATAGYWQALVQILSLAIAAAMAVDAYRIAKRQIAIELGPQTQPDPAYKPSRLPVYVPMGLAALATSGFLAMVVFGMAILAIHGPRSLATTRSGLYAGHKLASRGQTPLDRAVGDLLTAAQDIQKLERSHDSGQDETEALQHDVAVFNTVIGDGNLSADDMPVAYYYRGHAFRLMNAVREHDGEQIDLPAAHAALADYDKVVAGGSDGYLHGVTVANAQYWAGVVERDYLHSDAKANSYWQNCALLSHAGCMHAMADAWLTGSGGQKVDINQALQLNSWAFSMGVQGECASSSSARSIAKIIHFTGVRRPGDDELAWIKRSYGLMDQLESARRDPDVCNRPGAEIEEFLYLLERGQRKKSILDDAENRRHADSTVTAAVIQLLSRTSDEKAFQASVDASKSKDAQCSAYFYALWYSEISKKPAAAENYYRRLTQIESSPCATELVYARKFKL